jgi:dolichol-phosphate mannosyltransferase
MSLAVENPLCAITDGEPVDLRQRSVPRASSSLKIALVIPTLREAGNICELLRRVRIALDPLRLDYEVIVVDDDSRDGTEELVTEFAARDPRVRLLVRRGQSGLAGAVLHGWQHTDASVLGVMDADLQHPPELLPELISALSTGNDLAIGSRYAANGSLRHWNPFRRLLSAAAIWLTSPVQRRELRTTDPMSGFFFLRRECIEGIAFQQVGFKLLLEILVRGRLRSLKEIPFAFGQRHHGTSKASLQVALDYCRLLAALYRSKIALRQAASIATLGRQEGD